MRGKVVCDTSIHELGHFDKPDNSTFGDALHQLLEQEAPIHKHYHCPIITLQERLDFNYFFLKRGGKDVVETRFADK